MKTIFFSIIIGSAIICSAGENEIPVKSKITEATVFTSGAQVTSEGIAAIPAGTSDIVFENLSPYINSNTIQAKGEGSFTILSVVHRYNYLNQGAKPKELIVLEDSLEILNTNLQLQQALRNVYVNEEAMLLANKEVGGENNGINAIELEKIANLLRNRLTDLAMKKLEIQAKEKKLNEQSSRIRKQINELNQGRNKSTGEIVITVSAKAPLTGKINVSYLVGSAGWWPSYDLRAKDNSSPIALTYRAKVYQSTGYDWKNVKITLSTGNPNLSGSKPVLNPWWLQFYSPSAYRKKKQSGGSLAPVSMPSEGYDGDANKLEEVTISKDALTAEPVKALSSSRYVEVDENQTTTEYNIDIPYTIPSDGKEYLVEIQQLSIPAMYSYYCAPKIDNDAFLLAKITGWDKYNLISGEANIYFEDTYVGKSYLNTASTTDTLDISLGRDKNVSITRQKLVDFSEKKIIGLNKKETSTYEISVRNKKKDAIEIQIDDQMPLSSNNEIVVEVLETGKADYNKESGKLTWKMKIAPAETQKVKFGYSVKYPKDKVITNL